MRVIVGAAGLLAALVVAVLSPPSLWSGAIRKEDPVRARTLLEESRRPDPGGAIVPLAEMLIAGEGSPADPKRAVSLLKGTTDSWMAKGMLGRHAVEGTWCPATSSRGST
jgi:hypothetical protein